MVDGGLTAAAHSHGTGIHQITRDHVFLLTDIDGEIWEGLVAVEDKASIRGRLVGSLWRLAVIRSNDVVVEQKARGTSIGYRVDDYRYFDLWLFSGASNSIPRQGDAPPGFVNGLIVRDVGWIIGQISGVFVGINISEVIRARVLPAKIDSKQRRGKLVLDIGKEGLLLDRFDYAAMSNQI